MFSSVYLCYCLFAHESRTIFSGCVCRLFSSYELCPLPVDPQRPVFLYRIPWVQTALSSFQLQLQQLVFKNINKTDETPWTTLYSSWNLRHRKRITLKSVFSQQPLIFVCLLSCTLSFPALFIFNLFLCLLAFALLDAGVHSSIYSCNVCTVTSLIVNGNLFSLDCLFRRPSPCWCILISSPFPLSTQPLPVLIFLT